MDKETIRFEIAELLESQWVRLIAQAELRHGRCPAALKGALNKAFWSLYSPREFWNEQIEKCRVKDNAVYYIDNNWRRQKTYIANFSLRHASTGLGKKGLAQYRQWTCSIGKRR